MAPVLSSGVEGPFSVDDPAARVLADYGLMEATESGLLPRPGFAEAFGGRARALADGIRSSLGQAATAVFVVPVLDGLAERFANGDGVLLDVGVGVAEMACAFCQAVPGARVVGIDPLPRAIELAAATVASHDLAGRVQLRCQGVEELTDEEAFDLAWLPLPFVPPAAVREGLPRVLRALRPGGWLLLPAAAVEPGASGEIARWQVHVFGGTLLSDHERTELLRAAGFESPIPLSTPPGTLPPFLAARRPR